MTDDERKELKKLTQDELIDLLDEYREDAEKQRAAEKREIMSRFFHGSPPEEEEPQSDDPMDLERNAAFQALKKKYHK